MEFLLSMTIGVIVASAVYLILRSHIYPVLLGVTLLSYAVNLFLFSSGRLIPGSAALTNLDLERFPDPLPQALVLTAIVIGFGMTAVLVVLALRAVVETGDDHVDGAPK